MEMTEAEARRGARLSGVVAAVSLALLVLGIVHGMNGLPLPRALDVFLGAIGIISLPVFLLSGAIFAYDVGVLVKVKVDGPSRVGFSSSCLLVSIAMGLGFLVTLFQLCRELYHLVVR